jgi:hypothetical protein
MRIPRLLRVSCAAALAFSAAATPGRLAAGPVLADELSVTGTVTLGGTLDLPEPPPSIAQKGSDSPPSAMSPMGLPSGHMVPGMKSTTSPAPAPRGAR